MCGIGHTRAGDERKALRAERIRIARELRAVHNGIIENHVEPASSVSSKTGTSFSPRRTRSGRAPDRYPHEKGSCNLADVVRATAREIRGSYAIAVIPEHEPGLLIAADPVARWSSVVRRRGLVRRV